MEALATTTLEIDEYLDIRPMNDWMREASLQPVPKQLFDDLWCEGELAIMFGDTGKGKSALAVQIGESIARGRPMYPFGLTAKPRDVLLLDFEMTEKQIEMRYSADHEPSKGDVLKKKYAFSKRFHRMVVRPEMLFRNNGQPIEDILRELLQPLIVKTRATVLIIDNITHMKRTADSHRETVPLMKELLRLKRRWGLSILAIAHTRKRDVRRGISINDMLSAGMLANGVDNIFAIGQSRGDSAERYIKHLKPRNAEALYDGPHVPVFRMTKIGGNFLGFEFTRFSSEKTLLAEPKDGANWPLIEQIKQMHDEGNAIRAIAEKLGMSKTNVHRHLQLWHPTEEAAEEEAEAEVDPTTKASSFPGCEEYDDEIDEVLELEDEYEDECVETALLLREHELIKAARAAALEAFKKTGKAPKLDENKEYREFVHAVNDYHDSDREYVSDVIEPILKHFDLPVKEPASHQPTSPPKQILAGPDPAEPKSDEFGSAASDAGALDTGGTDLPEPDDPLARMTPDLDARLHPIYVEHYLEDGRPRVWYKYEYGTLFRNERDPNGITRSVADATRFGKFVKRE
ncbi:MAG TPA: AAA family ATPase [Pyrinomonadaceae bacterium]|nr:AAA family ATPase [Pyrinomonadaceae bacterium]